MTKINLLPHLVTEKQKEVNDLFCNTPLLFNLLDVGQEFLVLVFLHGIFIRLIFHQRIVLHDEIYVLVTSSGEVYKNRLILVKLFGKLYGIGDSMAGLKCGNDAFHAA